MTQRTPLFALGRVRMTKRASTFGGELAVYLERHVAGDWGRIGNYAGAQGAGNDEIAQQNADAVLHGGNVVSEYETPRGRLIIMTAVAPQGEGGPGAETGCFMQGDAIQLNPDQLIPWDASA